MTTHVLSGQAVVSAFMEEKQEKCHPLCYLPHYVGKKQKVVRSDDIKGEIFILHV